MRPDLLAWAAAHALPAWTVPTYWALAGLAALVGYFWALAWARRDRANIDAESAAHVWGCGAALAGGFVYEALRMVPEAIARHSLSPLLGGGRAAYGGLLFGMGTAAWVLWRRRAFSVGYFDRVVLAIGTAFVAVRTGCFLAGCDYGVPTAGPLGVRFPAFSLAAIEHTAHGWVPDGARSLPVHPTQLYEVAVAIVATLLVALLLRYRSARDGVAAATWLTVYACGRFGIELLRADESRGHYGWLSSAQWTSVAVGSAIVLIAVGLWARRFFPERSSDAATAHA